MKTKNLMPVTEALSKPFIIKIYKRSIFEKFYDFMSNFIFGGKRTTLIIIISLFSNYMISQETKISAMAGYKSLEVGFTYLDEETELIYGVSASAVDSKVSEKRANNNDKGKHHEFKGDVTPAMFFNIGGKFEKLSLIGKLGGSYVEQKINKDPTKDLFLAFGLIAEYEISETIALRGSYDSVNSFLIGASFKL